MALSNIFREPRREIIETVVGIGALVPFGVVDYYFGRFLQESTPDHPPLVAGMMLGILVIPFAAFFLVVAAAVVHGIGEEVCGALQNRGVHLRPRNRP